MAVFTDIADWTSAQDTAAANEIVLAYSERRQCVGDAAVDPLEAGDNAQDTAFWKGMQDWVEDNCSKWVDDSNFSTATEYDAIGDVAYTLSSFRTEAGIADGFRRATEWPTDWTDYEDAAYSYGPIQAGDIRGPWIFEDLQKAFDALRWSIRGGNTANDTGMYKWVNAIGYDDALAAWPTGWNDAPYTYPYHVSSNLHSTGFCSAWRQYRDMDINDIATHVPHSADCYYYIYTSEFYDLDGLGMTPKTFFFVRSLALDSVDTRICEKITTIAAMPEYFRESENDWLSKGKIIFTAGRFFLKWEFSHTL
jgi:hypothetical protein